MFPGSAGFAFSPQINLNNVTKILTCITSIKNAQLTVFTYTCSSCLKNFPLSFLSKENIWAIISAVSECSRCLALVTFDSSLGGGSAEERTLKGK